MLLSVTAWKQNTMPNPWNIAILARANHNFKLVSRCFWRLAWTLQPLRLAIPFGAGAVECREGPRFTILVNKNTMLGSSLYSGIFTSPVFLPDSLRVVVCLGISHPVHLPPIWIVLLWPAAISLYAVGLGGTEVNLVSLKDRLCWAARIFPCP